MGFSWDFSFVQHKMRLFCDHGSLMRAFGPVGLLCCIIARATFKLAAKPIFFSSVYLVWLAGTKQGLQGHSWYRLVWFALRRPGFFPLHSLQVRNNIPSTEVFISRILWACVSFIGEWQAEREEHAQHSWEMSSKWFAHWKLAAFKHNPSIINKLL